jgi:hypothetical protein
MAGICEDDWNTSISEDGPVLGYDGDAPPLPRARKNALPMPLQ